MTLCWKNFYHTQKFQKQAYNKDVKPKSYISGEKLWLNSKYIKTKQNQKLEVKFFVLFWVFHPVSKQVYKLKLSKNTKYTMFFIYHC